MAPEANAEKPTAKDSHEAITIKALATEIERFNAYQENLAFALAPIKSSIDLKLYLQATPEQASPLSKLSPDSRQRFLSSLTFNEKGITGYYYGDLVNELTASEIYQILSLFGEQNSTHLLKTVHVVTETDKLIMEQPVIMLRPVDHDNMECVKRATCGPRISYVCTGNC